MSRESFSRQSLGIPLLGAVKSSRVLLVGAGGIGCELLKNLALGGFGEIHIVDLDTIDLSNLNRQFLFRHEHIKKPKALVAKDAAQRFNPDVKLESHHANIKDAQYNVEWFRGFHLVFNALDNLDARRHVNKMCLAADVPLIESGTTGFNGQVQVIKKGVTACYDCSPKETPRSYPVCTIRSTPSQPIHCIVWAKSYLLSEIFGTSEEETSTLDYSADAENATEIAKLRQESLALNSIRDALGTSSFAQLVFDKVFKTDVLRLRSMDEMWKSRKPPEALDYEAAMSRCKDSHVSANITLMTDQRPWTFEENVVAFDDSLGRLSRRLQHLQGGCGEPNGPSAIITFDKDDVDTLDFVTAAANLRSSIFGIETKSRFDVKQMAGNIIPAIATTNAIVAGLCVLQGFKALREDFTSTKEVFLSPFASERLLASDRMSTPNPSCPVCSVVQTTLFVDLTRTTLKDVVDGFVRLQLGYEGAFALNNEVGNLYDEDEDENLPKKLSELGITSDSFLTVIDDDDENPRVNVVINVKESPDAFNGKPFRISHEDHDKNVALDIPRKHRQESRSTFTAEPVPARALADAMNGETPSLIMEGLKNPNQTTGRKRSASYGLPQNPPPKRRGDISKDDIVSTVISTNHLSVEDGVSDAILIEDD